MTTVQHYKLEITASARDKASNVLKGFGGALADIGKIALGISAANALGAITQGVRDIANEAVHTAARVEEMTGVVDMLGERAGYSAEAIDNQVEAMKDLGLTTNTSLNTLAQATRYEIDFADALDMTKVAQDAAVISMSDSSETMDRLMLAAARGSTIIARTAGVSADFTAAQREMADQLGKSTEELTTQEKVQANVNAILKEGEVIQGAYARSMEFAGKQERSLNRYREEALRVLGTGLIPVLGATVDAKKAFYNAVIDNEDALKRLGEATSSILVPAIHTLGEAAATAVDAIIPLANAFTGLLNDIGQSNALQVAGDDLLALAGDAEEAQRSVVENAILLATGVDISEIVGDIKGGVEAWGDIGDMAEFTTAQFEESADMLVRIQQESPAAGDALVSAAQASADAWLASLSPLDKAMLKLGGVDVRAVALSRAIQQLGQHVLANAANANRYAIGLDKVDVATKRAIPPTQGLSAAILTVARSASITSAGLAQASASYNKWAASAVSGRARFVNQMLNAETEAISAGGGGPSIWQQIAARQKEWDRERVDSARQAALDIKWWYQDQGEFIADNAAILSEELAAEFAARTEAVRAEAELVKEHDAQLAGDLLKAESDYQSQKADLIEAGDEEGLALLEREQAERIERLHEQAELDAELKKEARDRELEDIRESAAAAGGAIAEEMVKGLGTIMEGWAEVQSGAAEATSGIKTDFAQDFFSKPGLEAAILEQHIRKVEEAARAAAEMLGLLKIPKMLGSSPSGPSPPPPGAGGGIPQGVAIGSMPSFPREVLGARRGGATQTTMSVGGDTHHYHIRDRSSAALMHTLAREQKHKRLNEFMGG